MRHLHLGLLLLLLFPAVETSHGLAADEKIDPQAVIKKAIQAMGGEEKVARSQSVFMKGTCTFYGMGHPIECTGEWFEQLPTRLKASYHMNLNGKDVTRVEAVTKDQGWLAIAGRVRDLPSDQLVEIREGMLAGYLTTLLPLRDPDCHLSSVGETEVAGRPAVGLKASREGHRDVLLYFDKQDGYLVKMQQRAKGMTGGEVDEETLYGDYRDFNGVRSYKKMTTKRDGKPFLECEFSEFQPIANIPDSTFAKPKSAVTKTGSPVKANH
jgi:hypothetical protein